MRRAANAASLLFAFNSLIFYPLPGHAKFTTPFMREKRIKCAILTISHNFCLKVAKRKGLIFVSSKSKRPAAERNFQAKLIRELKQKYPDAIITKWDPFQGVPDLLILHGDTWASLECKRSEDSPHQPNQDYWVDRMNRMSFSRFIYPENKEEVLHELEQSLSAARTTRVSKCKQKFVA